MRVPIIMTEVMERIPIDELDFSTRTQNSLKRGKIKTIGELVNNYKKLSEIRGFGVQCREEVNRKLVAFAIENMGEEKFAKRLEEVNA